MATQTFSVLSVPTPAMPRGARVAAEVFARLLSVLRTSKAAEVDVPARVREASQVRELAWRIRATDPGFAADLYAAADRHEKAGE